MTDSVLQRLKKLGFSEKEATVYLALLQFGNQPASVVAKKTNLPRPTVLFLFQSLFSRGYIRRSNKGRVQYFYADINDLEKSKLEQIKNEEEVLQETLPILRELKNPFTSPPKISFFDGIDGCKKAYSLLLQSRTEVYEFAAHSDLLKMSEKFMANFIKERAGKNILINTICEDNNIHRSYEKFNKEQKRKLKMFSSKKGKLYSSIAVYEDKVLLLNLYQDAFAILIQNKEVAETLKTIHSLAWEKM